MILLVFTKFKGAIPNSVTYILQVIIEIKMTRPILTHIQFYNNDVYEEYKIEL